MLNDRLKKILGLRFYHKLRFWLDLVFSHKKEAYSQFGEDQFLLEYFRGNRQGFFVDVGAFHPRKYSNTYALYQIGWKGVNIDATPGSMSLFRILRPRDTNLELAISDKKETIEFASWGTNAENTAYPEQVLGVINNQGEPIEKIILKAQTLTEVLRGLPQPLPSIDLLSVDVEGMDLRVLKSLDWETYQPRLIIAELFAKNIEEIISSELYLYLKSCGYKLVGWYQPSLIFERQEK